MTNFHFHQEFKYWLRGATGDENVTIDDGYGKTSAILGRKEEQFTARETKIMIEFIDAVGPKNVLFRSDNNMGLLEPRGVWGGGSSKLLSFCLLKVLPPNTAFWKSEPE